jgi:nitrile hydratase accessory protein
MNNSTSSEISETSEASASQELPLPENLQPPMANGEVIFDAPWQGRIFAMAVALSEQGVFVWAEFQQCLIDAIALFDAKADASVEADQYQYFDHFQLALENLLAQKGVVLNAALNEREQAFADRPHGDDHSHDHDHDHDHDHSHDH